MNERIRELAEQCHHRYSEHNIDLEKFAELIVEECVDSMEKCFAGGVGTDDNKDVWGPSVGTFKAWNGAIKFSRDKIKEHFGVKE
jgi:hypothetical protein